MTTRIAFVCVQNAGRSQMAAAFAKREQTETGADVSIVTGGTDPADQVHPEVVDVMREVGVDVSDNRPRKITREDLADCSLVITMGCGVDDVCPADWFGDVRDWDLEDPDGQGLDQVRQIRDTIEQRVTDLFDRLEEGS